jgi:uncharacterized protein
MTRPFTLLFLLASLALPARVVAIDCSKATTETERRVCASPRLTRLDVELNRVFSAARTLPGRPSTLVDDQKSWLRSRDACTDDDCLELAYVSRIQSVKLAPESKAALFAQSSPPASAFGRYVKKDRACWTDPKAKNGIRCDGEVEDEVVLSRGEGNVLHVTVSLTFVNGHTCDYEGDGEWAGGEARFTELDTSQGACVLIVRVDGDVLSTADPGGTCK